MSILLKSFASPAAPGHTAADIEALRPELCVQVPNFAAIESTMRARLGVLQEKLEAIGVKDLHFKFREGTSKLERDFATIQFLEDWLEGHHQRPTNPSLEGCDFTLGVVDSTTNKVDQEIGLAPR